MSAIVDKYLWWLPFGKEAEITPKELMQKLAKTRNKPQLLDVRTIAEWKTGAIRSSTVVSVYELKGQTENLGFDKSRPVVVICQNANRSLGGVRILRQAGYKDICHLEGGMTAWQKLNFPTVKPKL